MAGGYGTAAEHMNFAVGRALEYFDAGDHTNAIASFVSDMDKHPATEHIAYHPFTLIILRDGLSSRQEFEKAMRGFAH
jgi:hypothetical protein